MAIDQIAQQESPIREKQDRLQTDLDSILDRMMVLKTRLESVLCPEGSPKTGSEPPSEAPTQSPIIEYFGHIIGMTVKIHNVIEDCIERLEI